MDHESWLEWWTKKAPAYFTDKCWRFSRPELIERLNIKPYHCILEIGFGYGRELAEFCSLSINVYGVELTDWACEHTLRELEARKVRPLPRLRSYDGLVIPFPSGAFNVVYSCFVIQHVSRSHALKLMKEALRVLAHDGLVLFEFFGDPGFWDGGKDVLCKNEMDGDMYNNAWTMPEIEAAVEAVGGRLEWIETKSVTKDWGNHWACFGRKQ